MRSAHIRKMRSKKHPTVLHTIPNNPKSNKVDKSTLTDKVQFQTAGDISLTSNDHANEINIGFTSGDTDREIPSQTGAGKPTYARKQIVCSKGSTRTFV